MTSQLLPIMCMHTGDRLLTTESVATIKTWTFDPVVTATLRTTFIYKLERRPRGASPNAIIELQLPLRVTVTAATDDW